MWAHQYLPNESGIYFSDGTVILQSFNEDESIDVVGRVSLHDLAQDFEIGIIDEDIRCSIDETTGLKLCFGEAAAHGSIGYLTLIDSKLDKLIWFAFYNGSNPFIDAKIDGTNVIAVTNHGYRWKFPISSPETGYHYKLDLPIWLKIVRKLRNWITFPANT